MAEIDAQKFYKELEKSALPPIVLIHGEEPYLLQKALERIRFHFFQTGYDDFNLNTYFALDSDVNDIIDAVETLPMMANQRLVILREANDLTEKEWAQLEKVFNNPVDTTLFLISASKIDKRKKYFKILSERGMCVEFKKPFENQIPRWIHYIAKTLSLEITDQATLAIHKLVGNHLIEIEAELKKISDYIGSDRRIEVADVLKVVSHSREENVFDFTKALGENDRVQALEHLVRLLDQGQSEIGIVALIARHVRILLIVKRGQDVGLSGAKLANYAQVPPYFLEGYIDQANLWSRRKLEQTLLIFSQTDKALKSSPLSSHIWLENMVLKTCTSADNYY